MSNAVEVIRAAQWRIPKGMERTLFLRSVDELEAKVDRLRAALERVVREYDTMTALRRVDIPQQEPAVITQARQALAGATNEDVTSSDEGGDWRREHSQSCNDYTGCNDACRWVRRPREGSE